MSGSLPPPQEGTRTEPQGNAAPCCRRRVPTRNPRVRRVLSGEVYSRQVWTRGDLGSC